MQKVYLTTEERRRYSLAMDELELAELTPAELAKYRERQRELVFGEDYRVDAHGNPIEVGAGAPGRETAQHLQALERERQKNSLNTRLLEGAASADPDTTARLMAEATVAAEMDRLRARIAALEAAPAPAA